MDARQCGNVSRPGSVDGGALPTFLRARLEHHGAVPVTGEQREFDVKLEALEAQLRKYAGARV